jgi:hypothetical protein
MVYIILFVPVLVFLFFFVRHIWRSAKDVIPAESDTPEILVKKEKERKNSFLALVFTLVFLLGLGLLGAYIIKRGCIKQPLGPFCHGKAIDLNSLQINSDGSLMEIKDNTESPTIESISPKSAPKGSVIEIRGRSLSGFEGDLAITFEDTTGNKFTLFDEKSYTSTGGTLIKVQVKEPCQKGETVYGRYSGIASICNFVEMKPGTYKAYTEPWGKKSNEISFTLTK